MAGRVAGRAPGNEAGDRQEVTEVIAMKASPIMGLAFFHDVAVLAPAQRALSFEWYASAVEVAIRRIPEGSRP